MISLSKSDFQLASTCPKKLIYKKKYYPTSNDTNEYMEMLAQGGYVVGKMATLFYPGGIEIFGSTDEALAKTKRHIEAGDCVLFEAAVQSGVKLARIDILVKKGNDIHLIEVKSKSHDTDADITESKKKLKKYIEDVGYQYLVLSEAYSDYNIRCSLLMPDKAKRTNIDGLAGWFTFADDNSVTVAEIEELPAQQKPNFKKPVVKFKYENDPKYYEYLDRLKAEGILEYLDVTQDVLKLKNEIKSRADIFINILNNGINDDDYTLTKGCKICEFNTKQIEPNGYQECWGTMAYTQPHIFDLYFGGAIGHYTKGWYLDELIAQKKSSLFEVDPERLKDKKGELGSRAERQMIQIENTQKGTEWISPELPQIVREFKYPLHFVDFETYTGALPFFKGMRPYELIAFQWSCHTIYSPGATPIHREWIMTSDQFPNFEFATSLMKLIGNDGTPFMWASHENTVLRTILNQLEIFSIADKSLETWLKGIIKDAKTGLEGRLVDMNKLTQQYYFHPYMAGRTSIKKVLPAVWNHNPYLHDVPYFKGYSVKDLEGGIVDPYDTLIAGIELADNEDVVKGGTDAMRAYHRIRFDDSISGEHKDEIKRQLLQYCKLDTLAMVIIAYHWGLR